MVFTTAECVTNTLKQKFSIYNATLWFVLPAEKNNCNYLIINSNNQSRWTKLENKSILKQIV